MTVKEFVDGYKKATKKDDYIKKHIVDKYVPYEEKILICENIVNSTSKIEIEGNEYRRTNTSLRFLLFNMKMVELYTDIETSTSSYLEDFNLIDEYCYIENILDNINSHEHHRFISVLNMIDGDTKNEFEEILSTIADIM